MIVIIIYNTIIYLFVEIFVEKMEIFRKSTHISIV